MNKDFDNNFSKLRKLQNTELSILCELDDVCRKHNLTYYVVGGTLIGAARTGGFIPWDDDIDVSMPRKDFDRLISLKDEFGSDYFLQTHKTEKECTFFFAKLRKNGTYFGEEKFEHTGIHKGIFIDIFPLDYISDKPIVQKLCFKGVGLINGFIASKAKSSEYLYEGKSKAFVFALRIIQSILPLPLLFFMRNISCKICNALSNKKLLASLGGFHGYPKEIAPAKWWGKSCDILFENKKVMAPAEYKTLLTHMFGDYMTPPPESQRENHTVAEEKIIFEGCTKEDYQPKVKRKRVDSFNSPRYEDTEI